MNISVPGAISLSLRTDKSRWGADLENNRYFVQIKVSYTNIFTYKFGHVLWLAHGLIKKWIPFSKAYHIRVFTIYSSRFKNIVKSDDDFKNNKCELDEVTILKDVKLCVQMHNHLIMFVFFL